MPASPKPIGSVPEKHGTSKDVKESGSSPFEQDTQAPNVLEASEEETPELDESDLKDAKENSKIPYSRFKEVNEKAKRLEAEKDEAVATYKAQLQRALAEAEALRSLPRAPSNQDEGILDLGGDPGQEAMKALMTEFKSLKGEVTELRTKTSHDSLQTKIREVKAKYPDADELAVMGVLKHNPRLDPEEVAETLQKNVDAKVEKRIQQMLEHKAAKKKQATLPTSETGFRLKESEKPKTVKEASAKLKQLMSKLSF